MAPKYRLQIESFNEYSLGSGQKRFDCIVRADSMPTNLPLAPNLREPKRNKVVDGIIADMEAVLNSSPDAVFIFPDPIHLVVESVTKEYSSTRLEVSDIYVTMLNASAKYDFVGHGVINGGHRQLSISLSKRRGLDLSRVKVPFCIHVGVKDSEVKKLAIQSNSSTKVGALSTLNAEGYFDEFKKIIDSQPFFTANYPWVAFYENDRGIPIDPRCTITHLIELLTMLDSQEYKYSMNNSKRHPVNIVRSGALGNIRTRTKVKQRALTLFHLVHDVIAMEYYFYEIVKKYCKSAKGIKSPLAGVGKKFSLKSCLPNGTTYKERIHQHLAFPVISSFRAIINMDEGSASWEMNIDDTMKLLIDYVWENCYRDILVRVAKNGNTGEIAITDIGTWDKCYATANQFLVEQLKAVS